MSETFKTGLAGIIAIGMITAVGLHATGLAKFASSAGQAGGGLLGVAETGGPNAPKNG